MEQQTDYAALRRRVDDSGFRIGMSGRFISFRSLNLNGDKGIEYSRDVLSRELRVAPARIRLVDSQGEIPLLGILKELGGADIQAVLLPGPAQLPFWEVRVRTFDLARKGYFAGLSFDDVIKMVAERFSEAPAALQMARVRRDIRRGLRDHNMEENYRHFAEKEKIRRRLRQRLWLGARRGRP